MNESVPLNASGRPRRATTDLRKQRRLRRHIRTLKPHAYAQARRCPGLDTLHEECGIVGIHNHEDATLHGIIALHALQHRGQEAVGMVTTDGSGFNAVRKPGLVSEGLSGKKVQKRLKGRSAIGHVRYATTGEGALHNVQPLFGMLQDARFAISHNGNLTNAQLLRQKLAKSGAIFQSTTDTEVVLHLVARSSAGSIVDRFIEALGELEGGYAFVVMTDNRMIGARDPNGIRPLILGRLDGAYVLVSETCALETIGAQFEREVRAGEVVVIDEAGVLQSIQVTADAIERPCVFEFIYFSRPDSVVRGEAIYDLRKAMGAELAREAPVDADVVVPIPDSGVPAALGFATELGIPFELGIIRNHYIGRTFIQAKQKDRARGVALKHSANPGPVRGKRVVLVDDSIVRGNTSSQIVAMMKRAGALEVHMRIACPPIRFPDFYGIDTPKKKDLMAATHSVEQIRDKIGARTLSFLSIDGLYRGLGYGVRDADRPALTDHCFTGDYPTELTDQSVLIPNAD